ncbi:uncharacterized protein LOC144166730 [Haemaphysalis longicornis]
MAGNICKSKCEVTLRVSQPEYVSNLWSQVSSGCLAQHSEVWSVDFKMARDLTVRCEAVVDEDKLQGRLNVPKMRNNLASRDLQIPLGNFVFSFDRIKEAFETMNKTSTYDLVFNNSRTWAEKLLETLGVAIPEIRRKPKIKVFSPNTENCEVVLGFSRLSPGRRKFFSKNHSSLLSKRVFMHWHVDFIIDGSDAIRCQAGEENGLLTTSLKMGEGLSPPEHTVSLGRFKLGYNEIMRAVKDTKGSGQYHVVKNNCQTWVVALLQSLSIPVPTGVLTIAEKIESVFQRRKVDEAFNDVVPGVKRCFRSSELS